MDVDRLLAAAWERFAARVLNPLIRPLFRMTTNWDPGKDLVGSLRETFEAVEVHRYNADAMFIAVASRPSGPRAA